MNEKKGTSIARHAWGIHASSNETDEILQRLEDSVQSADQAGIIDIIKDPVNLRSLIVRRGEKQKAHKLLAVSFESLLKDCCKFGMENLKNDDGRLILYLREHGIPEQYLNEMTHAYYHLDEKAKFDILINYILANEGMFRDREVPVRALHDLASWKATKENNISDAIELNKRVIEESRKQGFCVLEKKATFGLAYQKDIKQKNKISGFEEVSKDLGDKHGDPYDALRGQIEKNWSLLRYSRFKSGNLKEELLLKAKNGALDCLKQSIEMRYVNAEMLSSKLLSEIYRDLGDDRKADSYEKRIAKMD